MTRPRRASPPLSAPALSADCLLPAVAAPGLRGVTRSWNPPARKRSPQGRGLTCSTRSAPVRRSRADTGPVGFSRWSPVPVSRAFRWARMSALRPPESQNATWDMATTSSRGRGDLSSARSTAAFRSGPVSWSSSPTASSTWPSVPGRRRMSKAGGLSNSGGTAAGYSLRPRSAGSGPGPSPPCGARVATRAEREWMNAPRVYFDRAASRRSGRPRGRSTLVRQGVGQPCRWTTVGWLSGTRGHSGPGGLRCAADCSPRAGLVALVACQVSAGGSWPCWVRRSCSLMRRASSIWSSRMMMRQAASMGVPWSTRSRARMAIRSW